MLRRTPAQVWALIGPAEHASVLSANIVRGFTVPGTLTGVGQQQCFIDLHGNTCIIEVVEYEEGRRAVTRAISLDRLCLCARCTRWSCLTLAAC